MIRLIVQTHEHDFNSGFKRKDFTTIDVDLPDLEKLLKSSERGENGFCSTTLVGAEIFDPAPEVSVDDSKDKQITDLIDILVSVTHHEGALEEYKERWLPIVQGELERRAVAFGWRSAAPEGGE